MGIRAILRYIRILINMIYRLPTTSYKKYCVVLFLGQMIYETPKLELISASNVRHSTHLGLNSNATPCQLGHLHLHIYTYGYFFQLTAKIKITVVFILKILIVDKGKYLFIFAKVIYAMWFCEGYLH